MCTQISTQKFAQKGNNMYICVVKQKVTLYYADNNDT